MPTRRCGARASSARGRLGGQDRQARVQAHRVRRDDLAARPLGQGDGGGRLAGRRGPEEGDDGTHRSPAQAVTATGAAQRSVIDVTSSTRTLQS